MRRVSVACELTLRGFLTLDDGAYQHERTIYDYAIRCMIYQDYHSLEI